MTCSIKLPEGYEDHEWVIVLQRDRINLVLKSASGPVGSGFIEFDPKAIPLYVPTGRLNTLAEEIGKWLKFRDKLKELGCEVVSIIEIEGGPAWLEALSKSTLMTC